MTDEDKVTLELSGTVFEGWEEVQVVRSMDQATSTFSLVASEDAEDGIREILPGMPCSVRYGKDLVVTGVIDSVEIAYSASEHTYAVTGRSTTKDLVDCAALPESGTQFKGQTVLQIATKLAEPYGVKVRVDPPAAAIAATVVPDFQVPSDGQAVNSVIQDLLEKYHVYLADDTDGALVLAAVGARTPNLLSMVPGKFQNVLSARVRRDESSVYSEVRVRGQQASSDESFGTDTAQVEARSTIAGGRKRVKILNATTDIDPASALQQATKERQASLAESFQATYVVQGWRGTSELWRENRLVEVQDDWLNIKQTMLVLTVTYSIGESGTTCTLDLVLPEARMPIEKPVEKDPAPSWDNPPAKGAK